MFSCVRHAFRAAASYIASVALVSVAGYAAFAGGSTTQAKIRVDRSASSSPLVCFVLGNPADCSATIDSHPARGGRLIHLGDDSSLNTTVGAVNKFLPSWLGTLGGTALLNITTTSDTVAAWNKACDITGASGCSGVLVIADDLTNTFALWQGMPGSALEHLATNASLKNYAGPAAIVVRDSYLAVGDGGMAVYTYSSSACIAADNGLQVQATALPGCWIMDIGAMRPDVRQWGANTAAEDNSTALQAAFNACVGRLFIPPGNFNYQTALTESCTGNTVEGAGRLTTTLNMTAAGVNGINITGSYNTFRGFGSAGGNSSPADVWYITGASFTAEDFIIRGGYNDVHVKGNSAVKLIDFDLLSYANAGLLAESLSDLFIDHFILNAGTQAGSLGGIRLLNRVEAFNATDGDILGGQYSLTMDASTFSVSERPAYNSFVGVYFDSSNAGSLINNTILTDFTNCWWSGGRTGIGYPGLTISTADSIHFIASKFVNNGSHGVLLKTGAARVTFIGSDFSSNSAQGQNTYDGLHVSAGVSNFSVIGSTATNASTIGGRQRYGIYIENGASDRYIVIGNQVYGNALGGISDNGTGSNKTVVNNY